MRSILIISVFFLTTITSAAQRACVIKADLSINEDIGMPSPAVLAPSPRLIIIPVVVHVIYNNEEQNITDEQIHSQIAVLNKDYRKKNQDAANIPDPFKDVAADANIEFRLATVDPSGLSTSGIVRTRTSISAFGIDDKIKSAFTGGDDAWNREEYLNLWVGNINGGVMGYASAPGCAPEKDGVVIRYNVFGSTPNLRPPYNKGRTAVHEIGHWLGLRHIWGDSPCGDDKIDDTPPQQGPTRGCPSGVIITCSSGTAGNMYMNFMDFTNDECTNMFTRGQVEKMRSLFAAGGRREPLLWSRKAEGALTDAELLVPATAAPGKMLLFPNPAVNSINIMFNNEEDLAGRQILIYNHLGQISRTINVTSRQMEISISSLQSGIYFVSSRNMKAMKFIKAN